MLLIIIGIILLMCVPPDDAEPILYLYVAVPGMLCILAGFAANSPPQDQDDNGERT